jgi:hypothetical protein
MSQANYAEMTNEQIKQCIVKHSEGKAALNAYLERRNLQVLPIIANVKDTDFDDKLRTAISQKLENPAII